MAIRVAGFHLRSAAAASLADHKPKPDNSVRIKGKVINSSISDCRIQIFQSMVGKLQPFDTATDGTAFWSTNTNVEKTSHMKNASAWGGFRRARLVQCMARLRLSRLSERRAWRCAPVFLFAAPPLTGAGEPKTWLVRLLRRDCWPEIFNRWVSSHIPLSAQKMETV
jgi:hypothetical protein